MAVGLDLHLDLFFLPVIIVVLAVVCGARDGAREGRLWIERALGRRAGRPVELDLYVSCTVFICGCGGVGLGGAERGQGGSSRATRTCHMFHDTGSKRV